MNTYTHMVLENDGLLERLLVLEDRITKAVDVLSQIQGPLMGAESQVLSILLGDEDK